MNTAHPDYHGELNLKHPARGHSRSNEHLFFGEPLRELEDSAKVTSDLIAFLEQDVHPQGADAIRTYREHFDQMTSVVEHRYARIERLETDPLMIAELHDQALALILELPISQYLASIRPGILLWRDGDTYHGPCPYMGHDFDEDSFRIFGDDFAWCQTCGGGNLFRVLGLVEALPSPYEQVRRAAEVAGLELLEAPQYRSQNRSFPTDSHREMGRKERSGAGSFAPIRVVNGRVAS